MLRASAHARSPGPHRHHHHPRHPPRLLASEGKAKRFLVTAALSEVVMSGVVIGQPTARARARLSTPGSAQPPAAVRTSGQLANDDGDLGGHDGF